MSLLMDALKQAESSKQPVARNLPGNEPSRQAPEFSLEPILARPANAGLSLPNLAQHIASLNADLETSAPSANTAAPTTLPPRTPPPMPSEEENRATVRTAFAAKEAKLPSHKRGWLAIGALSVMAIGIGAYAWHQNTGSLKAANSPRPAVIESMPARSAIIPTPQAAAASAPAVPILASNSPSTAPNDTPPWGATLTANPERRISPVPSLANQTNHERENTTLTPIHLIRSQPEPDANLQRGYANLQGNSLDLAQQDYEQAERNDPNNVDALLGLAAIAQRQGLSRDAERYQQRALIADPRDAGAQAAALGHNENGNSTATESRLKTLLSAQPESAQLNFALGNVYAKQARWNEAQQVYFNAVAGDTDNPDYLFNLAVSLDQLHQPKLAAQHYRLALEAGERRPAAFNRERANQRLSQLP